MDWDMMRQIVDRHTKDENLAAGHEAGHAMPVEVYGGREIHPRVIREVDGRISGVCKYKLRSDASLEDHLVISYGGLAGERYLESLFPELRLEFEEDRDDGLVSDLCSVDRLLAGYDRHAQIRMKQWAMTRAREIIESNPERFFHYVCMALDEPTPTRAMVGERESRSVNASVSLLEQRRGGAGLGRIDGYAVVFDAPAEIWMYGIGMVQESVKRGAFAETLRKKDPVNLNLEHENGLLVLASTRNGSLKLREDSYGLHVSADIQNTSAGRDVAELVGNQTLQKMSFAFMLTEEGQELNFDATPPERRIVSVERLFDVSIVGMPAYESTHVGLAAT